MFALLCRIPFNPDFTELNTPFLRTDVIPVFIRIIATPQQHFFGIACPISFCVLESPSYVFRAANTPHPTCMHLVAQNHACPFLFSEAHISCPQIQGNMYFLKILITHPLLRSGILSNPLLTPRPVLFTLTYPTHTLVKLIDFYHNQLQQHLFPPSLLPQLPGPPHIPSQDVVKPIKQASQIPTVPFLLTFYVPNLGSRTQNMTPLAS